MKAASDGWRGVRRSNEAAGAPAAASDHDESLSLEEELESARAFLRRLDEPRSPVDPDKVAEQREIGKRQVRELEEQLR